MTLHRIWLHAMSTYPRQIAVLIVAGVDFGAFLSVVMGAATWFVNVAVFAFGLALGYAFPDPADVRDHLAEESRDAHRR